MPKFKEVPSVPDFVANEHKWLDYWYQQGIVAEYLKRNNSSEKRFSFLDGPITANNPMGVHHGWGRTLKDFYQRVKNTQGFKQRFQNGFDNQGLWVEVEVEKKLGFRSKKEIEEFGVAKFVEECKKHTLRFAQVQTEQSKRLGYLMDWENSYYTLSDENNYAIWHFLKKVWQDGNLYQGRDSVPWCPRCGTAISQHEILTEEYQEITHKSVILKLPVQGEQDKFLLAWTTTPWTIPGNVALAVDPKLTYAEAVKLGKERGESGEVYILAEQTAERFGLKILKKFKGAKLVGLDYYPPYLDLPGVAREIGKYQPRVIAADPMILAIDPNEGTGVVHVAPGAGTEDFRLGQKEKLPVIPEIDESGVFLEEFGDLAGLKAVEASLKILSDLEKKRLAFEIFDYKHRYPVCWRCKTELLWRVVDEWYIAMDSARHKKAKNYRQRLIDIIKDVGWIPSFGYERELDWLNNMADWLISKKRYWGLALPIWQCGGCQSYEVIGSREELEERAVEGWDKFEGRSPHRPWVDEVKIKCSACGGLASRIPDVGNPWLDAGIVPFSTLKYFADKIYWQRWFPADLVLESFPGQFKNWFYSLLAMSVVLEDKAPFRTLVGHATVKDEKGEEMHKSKGNAIWFDEAVEKMGADVMRWLYLSQPVELDLRFGYGPAEIIRRRFFLIFWNVYKFFVTYASLEKSDKGVTSAKVTPFKNPLDQWVISRLNSLVDEVTRSIENYDTPKACKTIESFVVGDFSTWYVRRSRVRVGPTAPNGPDKEACYAAFYYTLTTLLPLLAPFIPFLAEEMYTNLSGKESVHLINWPVPDLSVVNPELEKQMSLVRQIVEKGHAVRKEAGINLRQPLLRAAVSVPAPEALVSNLSDLGFLVKDELNLKEITLKPVKDQELTVELDTTLTPELKLEGRARELMRQIQEARKKADCQLNEVVKIRIPQSDENQEVLARFTDEIKQKTLTTELTLDPDISQPTLRV